MNTETNTNMASTSATSTAVASTGFAPESVTTTHREHFSEAIGPDAIVDSGVPESARVNELFRAFRAEKLAQFASIPPYQRQGYFPDSHPATWTKENWVEAFWEEYDYRLELIEEAKDELPAQARELCRGRLYEDERDAKAVLRAMKLRGQTHA